MLSKNVNNKKCAPKLIFFNEKKIEKDSDNFWYRKLTLKVKRLGDFALFDTSPLTQFSKFNNFLWVCWFLGKNLSNFVPPVWKLHNLYCQTVHCGKIMTISIELLQYPFLRQIKVASLHLKKLGQKLDSYGLHKCCVEPKKRK